MAESLDEIIAYLQEMLDEARAYNIEVKSKFQIIDDEPDLYPLPSYPFPAYPKMSANMKKKCNDLIEYGLMPVHLNTPHY
jgi:hypothetical protein